MVWKDLNRPRAVTKTHLSNDVCVTVDEPCGSHCQRKGPPDRNKLTAMAPSCKCRRLSRAMTGRRSSSIGCRSLLHRRSSVGLWYITCQDPVRVSHIYRKWSNTFQTLVDSRWSWEETRIKCEHTKNVLRLKKPPVWRNLERKISMEGT